MQYTKAGVRGLVKGKTLDELLNEQTQNAAELLRQRQGGASQNRPTGSGGQTTHHSNRGNNDQRNRDPSEYLYTIGSIESNPSAILLTGVIFTPRGQEFLIRVLLDTGAVSNNYLNKAFGQKLTAAGHPVTACDINICAPFSACSKCLGTLKLDVILSSETTEYTVRNISARVIESAYDLIIGLPTIKEHDLTRVFREIFVTRSDGIESLASISEAGENDGTTSEYPKKTAIGTIPDLRKGYIQRKLDRETLAILPQKTEFAPIQPPIGDIAQKRARDLRKKEREELERILGRELTPKEKVLGVPDGEIVDAFEDQPNELYDQLAETTEAPTQEELPTIEGDSELSRKLRGLVREYKDVFSRNVKQTPAKVEPMEFKLIDEKWAKIKPRMAGPPRKQSAEANKEIQRQVRKMIALGVIEPSQSSTYSQVLLAPKPGGKWRFCVDYRNLNCCILKFGWPLPNIPEMIDRIGQQRPELFAVMDNTSGFHQMLLALLCRSLTAFITAFGVYQPIRVPFGVTTAPSYYQQAMANTVFHGLIYDILEVYIDDILVFARTEEEYIQRLTILFNRLREFNVTLNPDKCKFGLTEVNFVGHLIKKGGYCISPDKITKVLEFKLPRTVKQLQSFLGLCNYFHEHVQNFSQLAKELFEMIVAAKLTHRLQWTPASEEKFRQLQQAVMHNRLIHFYDPKFGKVFVDTDASDYAIGGVVYQVEDLQNGLDVVEMRRPIRFYSRSLTPTERRWETIEKECFAIVKTVLTTKFLMDIHFVIRTDHRNLQYMNMDAAPKVLRWKLALQALDFDIIHWPGKRNLAADALSRLPQTHWEEEQQIEELNLIEEIALLDELDIPMDKKLLLRKYHNERAGHGGEERTHDLMRDRGEYWINMRVHIRAYIRLCPLCQKMSYIKPIIHANRFTTSAYSPMVRISVDTIGPLPKTLGSENEHLVVCICSFTRFVELYPQKTTRADETAVNLLDFFGRYGEPEQVISDNGRQFVNETLKAMEIAVGTSFDHILPYSKEENAIVERANREVLRHLTGLIYHQNVITGWDKLIPLVQRILNTTKHGATGVAPAKLLFGNSIQMDRGIFQKGPQQIAGMTKIQFSRSVRGWIDNLLLKQRQLIDAAEETLRMRDDYHLQQHSQEKVTEFPVDSYVLVAYPKGAMGRKPPTKLHTYWRGPLRVTSSDGNEYRLQNLVTGKQELHHITSLKKFNVDKDGETPEEVARHDTGEFIVEKILQHEGDEERKDEMDFLVKWEGLSEEFNLWLPWAELKNNQKLHDYLKGIGKQKIIPRGNRRQSDTITETVTNRMETRQRKRLRFSDSAN
jgi:hypothetical protein